MVIFINKKPMKEIIKQRLNEEFGKKDVTKEITTFIDSSTFKTKIEKIIKDKLKNDKELEDKIVDITKNVITQLYKTLWTKRGFWRNDLKNKIS
jgi:hypothetical protein